MAASNLQVGSFGISGNVVSVSVFNPQSSSETARIRVTVRLVTGDAPTLTSPNFTIGAGETKTIQIAAAGAIASIQDGPSPIDPL